MEHPTRIQWKASEGSHSWLLQKQLFQGFNWAVDAIVANESVKNDVATQPHPRYVVQKGNFFTLKKNTLQGTNISPIKGTFEDDFPFPKVGYVSSLEGIPTQRNMLNQQLSPCQCCRPRISRSRERFAMCLQILVDGQQ